MGTTLHAYRCGHKVFSNWLRDQALSNIRSPRDAQTTVAAVADFAIEYTDAISTVAASAYLARSRMLADVAGDQRAQLLKLLLSGFDESDERISKLLGDSGFLDTSRSYCVAVAQSVVASEMLVPERARRIIDTIQQSLRTNTPQLLIDLHDHKVVMVFSQQRRQSGWTPMRRALADQIAEQVKLMGNSLLIGIGNDMPSTAHIPRSYREAMVAFEHANPTQRVSRFAELSSWQLLVHFGKPELHSVLPSWASQLALHDRRSSGALVSTIRTYASSDMNVLQAAASLSVHPNTVYARLRRIAEITGLDARRFTELNELLVVTAAYDSAA
jgi:DNA-binding PucR family transcriptional regulator